MLTNPDGFRRLYTARRTLFRRAPSIDLNDVRSVQVGLVFEQVSHLLRPKGRSLSVDSRSGRPYWVAGE